MNDIRKIESKELAETVLAVIQQTVQQVLSDPQIVSNLLVANNLGKTLSAVSAEYKTYLKDFGFSEKYQISVKATLNKGEFLLGPEKGINEITSKHIEELVQFCKRRAPAGYKVDFRNLKAFFSKLVSWGYLKDSPCKNVKLPKEQHERRDYLTGSDLQTILQFVQLQVLKDIYTFTFQTALRLGEVLSLRWSDVSIKEKLIRIGSKNFVTKSRKVRTVPLSDEATEMLQRRFPKIIDPCNDYVFIKKDGAKYSNDFVSKSFKKAVRAAGINGRVCFHSLRHAAISHALNNGAPISAVREFAGHGNIQTTQNYLHTNLDDLRKVSQTFNHVAASNKEIDNLKNIAEGQYA